MSYLGSVLQLQAHLLKDPAKLDIDALTHHHFAEGVYVRELRIPAGNIAIGKMHRFGHISILLDGEIAIATESGSETMIAPKIVKASPGVKRTVYAITDTVWLTIHGNSDNETDLRLLEDRYIVPEVEVLEMSKKLEERK